MFIRNGFVKCVAINQSEDYFTIGKVYAVVNNTITNDNDFCYHRSNDNESVIDWLSHWYTFEPFFTEEVACDICGEMVSVGNYSWVDGKPICNDCFEDNVYFCDECGRAVLEDDAYYINERTICTHCVELNYITCHECGELVYRYDAYRVQNGGRVCESCADMYYHTCHECGDLVHEDDCRWDDYDDCYCPDCYDNVVNRNIHEYNYKPIPIFYGKRDIYDNPLYLGVELEIDKGGEDNDNAGEILNCANRTCEHIYCKHDGSLNDGFEIVSHPMTLEYHLTAMNWDKVMECALGMGYRSHDTDTCGLHVHVSRVALGETWEESETTISKILYFIESNWDKLLKFTRRTENNLRHWASRYGIEDDIESTYKKAKDDWNRYRCLNLNNDSTIEFRIFRGTLNYRTFVATLQLVYLICESCMNSTIDDIYALDWNTFVSRINTAKYPELMEYLNIRGLNV